MSTVEFYRLPRALQDRFVESARGISVPAPLVAKAVPNKEAFSWAVGSIVCLLLWFAFSALGFGDLEHALALAGLGVLSVHVLLAAGAALCALKVWATVWRERRIPYRRGIYVFPFGVIDASRDKFQIRPLSELKRVDATAKGRIVFQFDAGAQYEFDVGTGERAELVRQQAEEGQRRFLEAQAAGDQRTLALLNPLEESGYPNPLAPTTPRTCPVFMSVPIMGISVLVIAVPLAALTWWGRNVLSEKALLAKAQELGSIEAYRLYLTRGGTRADVRDVLLPRAELMAAKQKKTVRAIEDYIRSHPNSKIQAEVTAAHREALLAVLSAAKKSGTLDALSAIEQKYSGHGLIEKELAAAKHQVYERAFENVKAKVPKEERELIRFTRALLDYSEKHGPSVEIRIRRRFPDSNAIMDRMIEKSPYYQGTYMKPLQYFEGEYAEKRERALAEEIQARFQKLFPPDVLKFEIGSTIVDQEGELPTVKKPTLFIDCKTRLAGGFISVRPRGVYVGTGVSFQTRFVIPGKKIENSNRYSFWEPPDINLLKEQKLSPAEVYQTMAQNVEDEFKERFFKAWFGKSSSG